MSVRVLNPDATSNADVGAKTFPAVAPQTPLLTPWVRNPTWPPCEANSGDNRIRGLFAVYPSGSNFISMTISGAYTVDYGDGTTSSFAAGVSAYYEYSYADVDLNGTDGPVTFTDSTDTVNRVAHGYTNGMTVQFYNIVSTTGITAAQFYYVINAAANSFQVSATVGGAAVALTTDGSGTLLPYKIATVTITPQTSNDLSIVNLCVKYSTAGLPTIQNACWLDLAIASPTITSLTLGASAVAMRYPVLARIRLNELGAITSLSYFCYNMNALQNVEIASTVSTVTTTDNMFNACYALQSASLFNTVSVTNMTSMFNGCIALVSVPQFNTVAVTNMSSMFINCTSLAAVPVFDTTAANTMLSMFSGCTSLVSPPAFNSAAVTTTATMFQNCTALQSVPLFNTAGVLNMSSMFSGCVGLRSVPLFNTVSVTNMTSMFQTCTALTTVPLFNNVAVTTMSSMFLGCTSLVTVPPFSNTALTIASNMFSNCSSLVTVPLFNTALVTNMSSMFSSCISLQSVPLFNTAAVTSMTGMFNGCVSLIAVPLFNTAIVTNMSSMFSGCTCLQTVPLFNTVLVNTMASMFFNCYALQSVPLFNTVAVSTMNSMFQSCVSLTAIPLFNTANVQFMLSTFQSCRGLQEIPALVVTGVISGSFSSIFLSAVSLSRIQAKNFRFSFSVAGLKLSGTALDEIYTNLPTATGQTITVTGNYGISTSTPAIATAKGWTVTA